MSQNYSNISVTEKVSESLNKLLERDSTGVTCSAGTTQPQDVESWMIGRLWLDTQLKCLKYLSSVTPSVIWSTIVDFSQDLATEDYVQTNYQPLSNNLTMLSNLVISADSLPYFNSATSMSTLPLNTFLKNLLNVGYESQTPEQDVRTLLGLGSLSTVDSITSSNVNTYIANSSLPVSKFNFTPISSGEGYTTGDIKESYNSTEETGYVELNKSRAIGDNSSGAYYRGSAYNNLYLKLWGNPAVSYKNSNNEFVDKGNNASSDWNSHIQIKLPEGTNYINPNCYYRMKV